jgi:hypothetical protein
MSVAAFVPLGVLNVALAAAAAVYSERVEFIIAHATLIAVIAPYVGSAMWSVF